MTAAFLTVGYCTGGLGPPGADDIVAAPTEQGPTGPVATRPVATGPLPPVSPPEPYVPQGRTQGPVPPLPPLAPDRPLTKREARALVLNLLPPLRGSAAGDWPALADTNLEDSPTWVCHAMVPLLLTDEPSPPPGYVAEWQLVDFGNRGLMVPPIRQREASISTYVLTDPSVARLALRSAEDALKVTCKGERARRRSDLEPVPVSAHAGSVALTNVIEGGNGSGWAETTIAIHAGAALVVLHTTGTDPATADADALRLWKFAEPKLRAARLLP